MTNKYVRSNDKMIAGVCQLIAKETGIDVGIVRIVTAVLGVLTSGLVLVAYLVAWAVLPAEGQTETIMDKAVREGQKFVGEQKAKKGRQSGAQPGPAPYTPNPQQTPFNQGPAKQGPYAPNGADPDPFDLYKD